MSVSVGRETERERGRGREGGEVGERGVGEKGRWGERRRDMAG